MESKKSVQRSTGIQERIQKPSYPCKRYSSNNTTATTSIIASTDPITNNTRPVEPSAKKRKLNTDKLLPPLLLITDMALEIAKPPAPPRHPKKWSWKCHKCMRIWKMGVTQRCLSCNHRMCSGDSTSINVCESAFDYRGWRRWGEWKTNLKQFYDEQSHQEDGDEREDSLRLAKCRLFSVRPQYKKYSCWDDCVYPSQCYDKEEELNGTLSPIGEEDEEDDEEE